MDGVDLIVAVESDVAPLEVAARTPERLDIAIAAGRIRVETIPCTTHFLPMERPDLVDAALREAAR